MRRTEATVSMVLEALMREPASVAPKYLWIPAFLPLRENTGLLTLAPSSRAWSS